MAIDWVGARAVAIAAAREAGALIRADFHRVGGPRGSGEHADVDEEAETLIRERLLGAFPQTAWLGEETGAGGVEGAAYRWVVDPNDGTASYLRGFRGSAVSIALVHEGVPVLGVVYAPLAPDDDGDLFAWAEGQPLTRNGKPVERRPLPRELDAGHVVLVSQDADRNVTANAACCAPARYRPAPSIAYRLALVAAGEGDAAVSLAGPTSWDLAGGHALLRAVGGELVDQAGMPIRYARGGGGASVFGGSLEVAQALAARPWRSVFAAGGGSGAGLVRLERGRAVADPGLLRRAQGALLGQLAGDALGSMVEFRSADAIARSYPDGLRVLGGSAVWRTAAGQPTDDSELALALARTLISGRFDGEAVAAAYRTWLASGPFDVGGTTRVGLSDDPDAESQANGGLMRVSPLGIFGHALPATRLARLVREECALTHPHPVCRDASAAYAVALAHAVRTGDGPREIWQAALAWARGASAEPAIVATLEAAEREPPSEYQHQMGWVRIALQNAFYQLLHAGSLEEGVVRTVMAGGDTDTNAAIAGALLGAVYGRDEVPLQWRRMVLTCRAHRGTAVPRDVTYWPVDALELAERLLLARAG